MSLLLSLQVGLKEWASVCRALESGRQIVLFRKGGINDAGGVFQLEERQFLLFPTYVHQKADLLKPSDAVTLERHDTEPAKITIHAAAEVTDVVKIHNRAVADRIHKEHIWSVAQLDVRFSYKPDKPLFVVLLRTYQIQPLTIANSPVYAGCRSWVPLDEKVDVSGAEPVLDDDAYAKRRDSILRRLTK